MNAKLNRTFPALVAAVALVGLTGCASLSSPPTEREQGAGVGALAGGASGAIIGSMAGGAVAGGLFGMPIGAVAGYFIGDQMAHNNQQAEADRNAREQEMERLRRENQRLRNLENEQ